MEKIDAEIASILHRASQRALAILTENRDKLDRLAEGLVEEEELSESQITKLIGPSVHAHKDSRPTSLTDGLAAKDPVPEAEFSSSPSAPNTH